MSWPTPRLERRVLSRNPDGSPRSVCCCWGIPESELVRYVDPHAALQPTGVLHVGCGLPYVDFETPTPPNQVYLAHRKAQRERKRAERAARTSA